MQKLFLYWNTLRYLKSVQIYGRLFSLIKKSIPKKEPILSEDLFLHHFINKKTDFLFHEPWNNRSTILEGMFTFLNISKKLGILPDWNVEADLLWKFNLHYFNWLHLLDKKEQNNIIDNWALNNPYGKGIAWHPYVTSLRIVSWCKNEVSSKEHLKSLFFQADYLYNNLEYYHPANHYIENARALIFAAHYLACSKSELWKRKGFEILNRELPNQILCDGAHFELSPMYHCIMLEALLDIINISDDNDTVVLKNYAHKMCGYLKSISDDNFNYPLFNDSTYEIAPSPKALFDYSKKVDVKETNSHIKTLTEKSGIYVIKDEKIYLAVDGGKIGPNHIPAHAHADIFNYELRFMNNEFIVDSGVYEYKKGKMRDYCRSTKAHNCLTIDGLSQAEMWGSFRVARRFDPGVEYSVEKGKHCFIGKYDGYSRLIGDQLIHTRTIEYDEESRTFSLTDNVAGKGIHKAESYIHLHPDVEIIKTNEGYRLNRGKISLVLLTDISKTSEGSSYYFPEFGKKNDNRSIVISSFVPCKLEYKIICEN